MTATTLADAAAALRAPFPPGIEQYRAGPTWDQDGTRWTRPLGYIDARAVFDRLDRTVGPDNWHTELERLGAGCYLCRLRVLGVVRSDVGQAGEHEGEKEKSAASDALKRAAVQFGIGAYLYQQELPPARLERRGNDWVLPRGWRPVANPGDRPTPEPPRMPPPGHAAPGITPKQSAKIAGEMARVGWTEQEGRTHLARMCGKRGRQELTSAEASAFIEHLLGLPGKARAG